MPNITILQQSAEEMNTIDQTFDLVYYDPPFGLQRDFSMLEEDCKEKSFSDHWKSFDDYIIWYADIINKGYNQINITTLDDKIEIKKEKNQSEKTEN